MADEACATPRLVPVEKRPARVLHSAWMGGLRIDRSGVSLERLALFAYLALQELSVLGLRTPRYNDSGTYLHLDLTGKDVRLPTVPLLYKIFPTDDSRIAAQVILATAAWWILAKVASNLIVDRRVRLGLRLALLALGLVTSVTSWNSVILSESAAISLSVLVIAVWLRFAAAPAWGRAAAALGVTLVWSLARQPNVLFGLALTVAALIALARSRADFRVRAVVAVGLVCVNLIGLVEEHRNQTLAQNSVQSIVQLRILPDTDWTAWFVAHGMPYSPALAEYSGVPRKHLESLPEFLHWVHTRGESVYFRFVLTHPGYALVDPLPSFSGEDASLSHPNTSQFGGLQPNPTPSMLSPSASYGRVRSVLPTVVTWVLWGDGQFGDVLGLAILAIGAAILATRRHGRDDRLVVPAIVTALVIPEGYILWLSGGEALGELDRLSMVTAVSVRVGLMMMLAFAVDRLITAARSDGTRTFAEAVMGAPGIEPGTSRV